MNIEQMSSRADQPAILEAIHRINQPVTIISRNGSSALSLAEAGETAGLIPAVVVPSILVKNLGDPSFCQDYGLKYPYVGGSMANGISSTRMVEALGRAGMLGFFGAAGLSLSEVEGAIQRLAQANPGFTYGFNLIHSPSEPALEAGLVGLYLKQGIELVEASAYLDLTLPLIRYRVSGIYEDPSGNIVAPHRILAKASRVEVAAKFFSPPPERFLRELVARREITEQQAKMAAHLPIAQDLTAEADSGGHTDNQSPTTLWPTMLALSQRLQAQFGYAHPLRVGAAGGIATPASALSAFIMGAAYIMTGSINQGTTEAGTSETVRQMLAQAKQADVIMAPAADMFELGIKVQVLKWGTMFPMRAAKLYELYQTHDRLEAIPLPELANLEKNIFRAPLPQIWEDTKTFFKERDPEQAARAERDPKHRLALIFRWYLGQASRWANLGDPNRKIDYQIFCGPAMGAFNEWVKGSYLEPVSNRRVAAIALNLLYGAAVLARLNFLRWQGIDLGPEASVIRPRKPEDIQEVLA